MGVLAAQKGFENEGNTFTTNSTAPSQLNREWASKFTIVHSGVIKRMRFGVDNGAATSLQIKPAIWEDRLGVPGDLRGASPSGWPMVPTVGVDANDMAISVVSGDVIWAGGVQGNGGYTPSLNITSSAPATVANVTANGTGSFASPGAFGAPNTNTSQQIDVRFIIQTSKN